MTSKYDIYRPHHFIRDVYSSDKSYYRAADITLTPQMTVGSLSKRSMPETAPKASAESPLLQKNFKLTRTSTSEANPRATPSVIRYGALSEDIGDRTEELAAAPVGRHLEWLPKKYSLEKGVYTDFSSRTFTAALFGSPLILLLSIAATILLAQSGPSEIIQQGKHGRTAPRTTITAQNASVDTSSPSTTQTPVASSPSFPAAYASYKPAYAVLPTSPVISTPTPTTIPDTSSVVTVPADSPTSPLPVDPLPGSTPPTDPASTSPITVVIPVPTIETTVLP